MSEGRNGQSELARFARSRPGDHEGIARTLSTVLSQAVEDGVLAANPALRLGRYLKAGDEQARTIDPLTRGEVLHLLATAREHFPKWHPLLLCAVRTGMRQGELIALRWSQIDFAKRFVDVNRSLVRGIISTPKTTEVAELTCRPSSWSAW